MENLKLGKQIYKIDNRKYFEAEAFGKKIHVIMRSYGGEKYTNKEIKEAFENCKGSWKIDEDRTLLYDLNMTPLKWGKKAELETKFYSAYEYEKLVEKIESPMYSLSSVFIQHHKEGDGFMLAYEPYDYLSDISEDEKMLNDTIKYMTAKIPTLEKSLGDYDCSEYYL